MRSPSRPLFAAPLVLLAVALFPGALAQYRGGLPWAAGCGYTGEPNFPGWPWADQISLTLVNYVPKTGVTPTGAFTLVYYANTDSVATRTSPQVTAENQCTTTGCTAENQCYRGTTTGTTVIPNVDIGLAAQAQAAALRVVPAGSPPYYGLNSTVGLALACQNGASHGGPRVVVLNTATAAHPTPSLYDCPDIGHCVQPPSLGAWWPQRDISDKSLAVNVLPGPDDAVPTFVDTGALNFDPCDPTLCAQHDSCQSGDTTEKDMTAFIFNSSFPVSPGPAAGPLGQLGAAVSCKNVTLTPSKTSTYTTIVTSTCCYRLLLLFRPCHLTPLAIPALVPSPTPTLSQSPAAPRY